MEKTFRGRTLPKLTEIKRTSYKADYRLIPKNEEEKYLKNKTVHDLPEIILPRKIEMPPLMKAFLEADHERKGLQVKIYNNNYNMSLRVLSPPESNSSRSN